MILPPWDILWICRPARLSAKSEPVHEVSMLTSMRGEPGPVWYWLHTEAVDLIVAQNPLAPLPYQLPVVNWYHLLPPRKHPVLKNITLPFPCSACPQNKQLQLLAALAIACCYLLEVAAAPQEAQLEPNTSPAPQSGILAQHIFTSSSPIPKSMGWGSSLLLEKSTGADAPGERAITASAGEIRSVTAHLAEPERHCRVFPLQFCYPVPGM